MSHMTPMKRIRTTQFSDNLAIVLDILLIFDIVR